MKCLYAVVCGIVVVMFETRKEREQKTVQDLIDDGTVTDQGAYVRGELSEVQTRDEAEVLIYRLLRQAEEDSPSSYPEVKKQAYALLEEYFPGEDSSAAKDTDESEPLQKAA